MSGICEGSGLAGVIEIRESGFCILRECTCCCADDSGHCAELACRKRNFSSALPPKDVWMHVHLVCDFFLL